jgi:hypothetical protein
MRVGAVSFERRFWIELCVALGFFGPAQLIVQFAVIARFKRSSGRDGIDAIMYCHRQIGKRAVIAVVVCLPNTAEGAYLAGLFDLWARSHDCQHRAGAWNDGYRGRAHPVGAIRRSRIVFARRRQDLEGFMRRVATTAIVAAIGILLLIAALWFAWIGSRPVGRPEAASQVAIVSGG